MICVLLTLSGRAKAEAVSKAGQFNYNLEQPLVCRVYSDLCTLMAGVPHIIAKLANGYNLFHLGYILTSARSSHFCHCNLEQPLVCRVYSDLCTAKFNARKTLPLYGILYRRWEVQGINIIIIPNCRGRRQWIGGGGGE